MPEKPDPLGPPQRKMSRGPEAGPLKAQEPSRRNMESFTTYSHPGARKVASLGQAAGFMVH